MDKKLVFALTVIVALVVSFIILGGSYLISHFLFLSEHNQFNEMNQQEIFSKYVNCNKNITDNQLDLP